MNKIDIIQRLLDDRHITAKEALVLMQKEVEYVYYPQYQWPYIPYNPYPVYGIPGTYSDTTNLIISSEN